MNNELKIPTKIGDIIDEYQEKLSNVKLNVEEFKNAGSKLHLNCLVQGVFGDTRIDTGNVYEKSVESSLLKSAWRCMYETLNIKLIASADDKRKFEQSLADPAPFTMENIRATFGEYILDPRSSILRGLAEAFCSLDNAYKSHSKVKIGVNGLPKRVIISSCGGYGSYGRDRIENVINALAQYTQNPLITHGELNMLFEDGDSLRYDYEFSVYGKEEAQKRKGRDIWLKRFSNGNGHLFFGNESLLNINRALAEYYGEVLCDTEDKEGEKPKKPSTAVSKDLQYYPTPQKIIDKIFWDINVKDKKVLEPSCGCGMILDKIRKDGGKGFGFEFDYGRYSECKNKGHNVIHGNFLESYPIESYDFVVMNPPFYGKHYIKHIEHAMKFLVNGGRLISILPATACYDHGLLDKYNGRFTDLPVGSFSESGTNVPTVYWTYTKR